MSLLINNLQAVSFYGFPWRSIHDSSLSCPSRTASLPRRPSGLADLGGAARVAADDLVIPSKVGLIGSQRSAVKCSLFGAFGLVNDSAIGDPRVDQPGLLQVIDGF